MKDFTETELNRIFSWLPYREDWPVDRNQKEDNISSYYGDLINSLTNNDYFETYYSEDGGLGNYLEFICYPKGYTEYNGNAILVCVSLCAPIVGYGQIPFLKTISSRAWGLFNPDSAGLISDEQLMEMEARIKDILKRNKLCLIDREYASRVLPETIVKDLQNENRNEGNQYLHGIFQKTD